MIHLENLFLNPTFLSAFLFGSKIQQYSIMIVNFNAIIPYSSKASVFRITSL